MGRLPGAGRYDGPLDGVPVRDALAGSRAWAVERLGALGARRRRRRRRPTGTARPGRWRRSCAGCQAHGFDHLWELERRLVRADGTGDRVTIVLDRRPAAAEVVALLRGPSGWDLRASEPASLERALAGTTEFATAWDGERLVGTARSITDGGQNALIATVVVHPAYQGLGVGERMMHLLTDGRDLVRFSLAAAPGLEPLVPQARASCRIRHAMFRPRRRR